VWKIAISMIDAIVRFDPVELGDRSERRKMAVVPTRNTLRHVAPGTFRDFADCDGRVDKVEKIDSEG